MAFALAGARFRNFVAGGSVGIERRLLGGLVTTSCIGVRNGYGYAEAGSEWGCLWVERVCFGSGAAMGSWHRQHAIDTRVVRIGRRQGAVEREVEQYALPSASRERGACEPGGIL